MDDRDAFAPAFSLTVVKAIVSAVLGLTLSVRAAQGRQEPLPLIGSLFTVLQ